MRCAIAIPWRSDLSACRPRLPQWRCRVLCPRVCRRQRRSCHHTAQPFRRRPLVDIPPFIFAAVVPLVGPIIHSRSYRRLRCLHQQQQPQITPPLTLSRQQRQMLPSPSFFKKIMLENINIFFVSSWLIVSGGYARLFCITFRVSVSLLIAYYQKIPPVS